MEESLGKKLIAARKTKGITINDAVYLAKIPRDVVIALETENFGFFSSPLYAKSFLKQYAQYIGTNVDPWLDDFVPITLIDGEYLDSYIDLSEPIAQAKNGKKTHPPHNSGNSAMAAVWLIVITAALIFGGIKVFHKFEAAQSEAAETETNSRRAIIIEE